MHIGSATFYLAIPWAKSLKDKRQCVRSIVDKLRHKFNISVAEIGENDTHTVAHIGFACVSGNLAHAQKMVDTVLEFVENYSEAEIYGIETEFL